jgi:hypothetical protein
MPCQKSASSHAVVTVFNMRIVDSVILLKSSVSSWLTNKQCIPGKSRGGYKVVYIFFYFWGDRVLPRSPG